MHGHRTRRVSWLWTILLCFGLALVHSAAQADDRAACANNETTDFDAQVAACTRLVSSGRYHGNDLAVYLYNRGVAYGRKGDLDKALADYDRSLAINSKDSKTHN